MHKVLEQERSKGEGKGRIFPGRHKNLNFYYIIIYIYINLRFINRNFYYTKSILIYKLKLKSNKLY